MQVSIEKSPLVGPLGTASKHFKVVSSTDKTITGDLRPRLLAGVDELVRFLRNSAVYPIVVNSGPHHEPQPQYQHASSHSAAASPPFMWIDVKMPTPEECAKLLELFPLHRLTKDHILTQSIYSDDDDRLEHFPAQGYTHLSLTGTPPSHSDDFPAIINLLLFDQVLVTLSDGDYIGEEEVALTACNALCEAAGSTNSCGGAMGISSVFSALVSSLVLQTQGSVAGLMIDVDQLDELVLQIQPSVMDQNDMLTRIRAMRHRVARFHTSLLLKERVIKQLLLPALRTSSVCSDDGCVEQYQRCLTLTRGSVERLRKGRDTVNLSCMTLVSGVSARLVTHCHWMDFLNHVQSQISLVVMPVTIIPGIFAVNISIPWMNAETTTPFWIITAITVFALLAGMIPPAIKYYRYKAPGALVPSLD